MPNIRVCWIQVLSKLSNVACQYRGVRSSQYISVPGVITLSAVRDRKHNQLVVFCLLPSTNGTAPPSNALDPCPFSVATLRTMSLSACLWNALAHCDCRTLSFSWTRPHQTPKYRLLNSPDGGSSEETSAHGSNGTSPESIPSSEIERVPTPRALHDNAQENMSPTRACNRKRARPPPSWHSARRKLVF